jgi:hypothetical protein
MRTEIMKFLWVTFNHIRVVTCNKISEELISYFWFRLSSVCYRFRVAVKYDLYRIVKQFPCSYQWFIEEQLLAGGANVACMHSSKFGSARVCYTVFMADIYSKKLAVSSMGVVYFSLSPRCEPRIVLHYRERAEQGNILAHTWATRDTVHVNG